jgi:hypothetical protein
LHRKGTRNALSIRECRRNHLKCIIFSLLATAHLQAMADVSMFVLLLASMIPTIQTQYGR